jgi:hypothetical protein
MSQKRPLAVLGDEEKPHPTVVEGVGDESGEPIAVRLGELWSEFLRVSDEAHDPDAPKRSPSAVPLLDEMKGILQWD